MGLLTTDLTSRISDLQPTSKRALPATERKGVSFPKYFTQKLEAGKTPYDEIAWELRTAAIANDKGAIIFEQDEVEVPADWSQTATNIVVSKYFYGKMGSPDRERSVRQLVHRVVDTIADWGAHGRYFKTREDRENFRNELAHLMLAQKACFNSPVWFNVGVARGARLRLLLRRSHRRHREAEEGRVAAAVLGVLHQLGEGFARVDSRSGQNRGHAVQVGLGIRHESFAVA